MSIVVTALSSLCGGVIYRLYLNSTNSMDPGGQSPPYQIFKARAIRIITTEDFHLPILRFPSFVMTCAIDIEKIY